MPGRIDIVGLGPGTRDDRTLGVQRLLDGAKAIIVRTAIHPGVNDLVTDSRSVTCDDLYEAGASFDLVYQRVAERVLDLAAMGDVVYAVPGHPMFGERAVQMVLALAPERGNAVQVHGAVSAFDAMATALCIDLLGAQPQLVDAVDLDLMLRREPFAGGSIPLVPSRPCLVTQVYARHMASTVKLALGRFYPETHQVTAVTAAGVNGEETVTSCPLHALDRQPVNHLTSVWVPALEPLAADRSFFALQHVVALLRAPDGCPWDRKQSHETLRNAVIEEAYEVVGAIDDGDPGELSDELGDLLLLVMMHAQIAEEAGEFAAEDVIQAITTKLIRRHPHVFSDVVAETAEAVVSTWAGVKATERATKGKPDKKDLHPIEHLPKSMPILERVAMLLAKGRPTVAAENPGDPGNRLFDLVLELRAAGLDPSAELERVARQRFPHPQPSAS